MRRVVYSLSCHIVKLGIKSYGHLSTLGIRFVLSFSLRSVAKLSIKSHSHVSFVGICLANNLGLRLVVLCSRYVCMFCGILDCFGFRF
jgi:hypothetical protein